MIELVPVYIGAALVLFVLLALLFIRIGHGRYAEQLIARAARVPFLRRPVIRSYIRDLEATDPLAARAYAKVERVSGDAHHHTQRALAVLTAAERRAYLDLVRSNAAPLNRAERRRSTRERRC